MKLLSLLFVMVMLVSCVGSFNRLGSYQYTHRDVYTGIGRTIPIWVDVRFGEADQISIDDAVNQWNYALNGYIKLDIVDSSFDMESSKIDEQRRLNGWLIMKIDSKSKFVPESAKPGTVVLGFVNEIGGNYLYLVRDRIGNNDVFGIMLHELAHLLSAKHNDDGLMYPIYTRAGFQCIDYNALNEVAEAEKLPMERLNYCINEKM